MRFFILPILFIILYVGCTPTPISIHNRAAHNGILLENKQLMNVNLNYDTIVSNSLNFVKMRNANRTSENKTIEVNYNVVNGEIIYPGMVGSSNGDEVELEPDGTTPIPYISGLLKPEELMEQPQKIVEEKPVVQEIITVPPKSDLFKPVFENPILVIPYEEPMPSPNSACIPNSTQEIPNNQLVKPVQNNTQNQKITYTYQSRPLFQGRPLLSRGSFSRVCIGGNCP
jgi:hypothetical protein